MYSLRECCNKPIKGKEWQDIIHDTWAVGLPHSIEEVRESGWREGGSGNAKGRKGNICRAYRTGRQMATKLESLTLRAREDPKCQFTSLAHLLSEDFLRECFRELKRDKASGIDGVMVQEYEVNLEENLKDLVGRMKAKRYRPRPVRRVYIPKPEGDKRGLGIPTVCSYCTSCNCV